MFATLLRVLFGFLVACLVAGAVQVGFVMTPAEIVALPEAQMYQRVADFGVLSLKAATQAFVFAAPFALVAAALAEWQALRGPLFYGIVGIAISFGGFSAIYAGEMEGAPTIVNSYASTAFAVAGLLGGLAYWMISGRFAGEGQFDEDMNETLAMPSPPRVNRPAAAVPPPRPVQPASAPGGRPTPAAPPPSAATPAVGPRKV